MRLTSLHDLYVDELKDLYNAENQLLKALPKMAKKASAPELRAAFTQHLEVTRGQVERLDRIFAELDISPKGKKCKAMEGLIEEGKEVIEADGEPAILDAALIACAQRVEHYEMAGYGCLRAFAKLLGYTQAAELLQQTLNEEGEADKALTNLAETVINVDADQAGEDDEGDVGVHQAKPHAKAGHVAQAGGDDTDEEGEADAKPAPRTKATKTAKA